MNAFTFESYECLHEFLTSNERLQLMRNLLPLLEATSIAQISGTNTNRNRNRNRNLNVKRNANGNKSMYICICIRTCLWAIPIFSFALEDIC